MLSAATIGMAQTLTVKDSITHEAVPFVCVCFGNDSGGYTDEQGTIAIPKEVTQIQLSHICFEIQLSDEITYTYRITAGVARNQNATYLLKNILKEQEI